MVVVKCTRHGYGAPIDALGIIWFLAKMEEGQCIGDFKSDVSTSNDLRGHFSDDALKITANLILDSELTRSASGNDLSKGEPLYVYI